MVGAARVWPLRPFELQFWLEPWTFALGLRLFSDRWSVAHLGPLCIGIGRP